MTKLIAEIGINHNGSLSEARKLIDIAAETNCWGIKFQYRNLKNYFLNNAQSTELGKEIIDSELKKNYLSCNKIIALAKYAQKKKLKVGLSLFTKNDYVFFLEYKFDFLKIPSPVCHDYQLINFLKKKTKLLIISFGGKNFSEIKKIIFDCNLKGKNTAILHCISNYPVIEINSNLGFLDKLKQNFKNFKIGYSSHEKTILNAILCLSKNLDFIERHITLDKNSDGLDHSSSSDPNEIKLFQTYKENFYNIFYEKKKLSPNQGEIINVQNLGVSYYAKKDFNKGQYLRIRNLEKRHPCIGLTDINIDKYLKKELKKDIKKGDPITESLFFKQELNQSILKKINELNFSIPIRPRDYKEIYNHIPIKNYELHLSYKDINKFKINDFDKKFLKKIFFTIHMPDYCDENTLIDFFSSNSLNKKKSEIILRKTIKIAHQIKKINHSKVSLIVSLAGLSNKINRFSYYKKIKKLTEDLKKKSINLLPQWLPVYAWYFGGNVKTEAFSDPKDLKFLKKIKLNICMDLSHYILSCNYYNYNLIKYFRNNISIFEHYHISDAKGTDGEGVPIGKGDIIDSGLLNIVLKDKFKVKVLETWQGHLNGLSKFKIDINTIAKILK